jgi:site-specific recombinase XerD
VSDWSEALRSLIEHWTTAAAQARLRSSSAARYGQVFSAFSRFAEASGVVDPESVTTALCRRFIAAPLRGGSPPHTSTRRLRLTVVRSAFQVLALTGVVGADPTAGLCVVHRTAKRVSAPLTPPEATRLVLAGGVSPRDTLRPATTALALLGAAHSEIAGCMVAAFCEADGTVTLGAGQSARVVATPPHLVEVFRRRLAYQRAAWRRRGQAWEPGEGPAGTQPAVDVISAQLGGPHCEQQPEPRPAACGDPSRRRAAEVGS